MKVVYAPEEIEVLERYIEVAFPYRENPLPTRSRASITQRLNMMRRRAGVLYKVRRK